MTLHEVLSPLVPLLAEGVAALAGLAALSLVGWLRARIQNKVAADALALVATNAATLVRGAAEEVRRRKDKTDTTAGAWTREDANRLRDRVVEDLGRMSAGALDSLRRTQRLDSAGVKDLLEQAVEAQVENLRREGDPPERKMNSREVLGLVQLAMETEAGQSLLRRIFGNIPSVPSVPSVPSAPEAPEAPKAGAGEAAPSAGESP